MKMRNCIESVDKQLSPRRNKGLENTLMDDNSFITNNTTLIRFFGKKTERKDQREIILNEPFMLGCNYHIIFQKRSFRRK